MPPVLRLRTPSVAAGEPVLVSATDAGAGVYPESIRIVVDGLVQERNAPRRPPLDLHGRALGRDASTPPAGVRLSGVEEHGERRAHPPQHAHGHVHVPRSLATNPHGRCADHRRDPAAKRTAQGSSRSRLRTSGVVICGETQVLRSRSSIVGSASRSRWTERMNSSFSSSGVTTRSCFLRFWRSRSRRADGAEARLQARLLHRDCQGSREDEQHEPRPAHGRILRQVVRSPESAIADSGRAKIPEAQPGGCDRVAPLAAGTKDLHREVRERNPAVTQ